MSQKELKEALRRQWSQLSDKRRLKWISKALELQKDYEVPDRTRPPMQVFLDCRVRVRKVQVILVQVSYCCLLTGGLDHTDTRQQARIS